MMTTYTRRGPGQSYLKSVLADRINSLIEHKELNLEINPLKARAFSGSPSSMPGWGLNASQSRARAGV